LVLTVAAHYYLESADLIQSVQLQTQSIEAARLAGNHPLELTISSNLGLIYATLGLYAQARATLAAGVARAEALGDRRLHANALCYLGYVQWRSGDRDLARHMEEQALKELLATDDAYGGATCQAYLGYILENSAELALAVEYLAQARVGFAKIGAHPDRFEVQAIEARVMLAQGQRAEARQLANEVWDYIREHGSQGLGSPSLAYLCVTAVFEATEGDNPTRAAREVIDAGYRSLMQKADQISDVEWRRSFLENVTENRTLIEKWQSQSAHPIGP
jgi:tetratricopeptide (TPR) repeat protein